LKKASIFAINFLQSARLLAKSAPHCKQLNQLTENIAREIRGRGPIPFARFMELALYCPVYGYYGKEEDKPGRAGDFYTSVSVGALFGELLAFRFADWLENGSGPAGGPEGGKSESVPVQIMEAGAHDGRLARDILTWLRQWRPALFARVEYLIAEPAAVLRERQREMLADFPRVRWTDEVGDGGTIRGIIFSNELLDAMPVHRYGWDARDRKWFEWGVTMEGERFRWTTLEGAPEIDPALPSELLDLLPDGFITEESPRALEWWRRAAKALEWGTLATLDYGLATEELLRPERTAGTLRAYRKHRVSDDLLANPGEQDLTAHVNFSAIREAGERAGLRTDWFGRQEEFLTRIAAATWADETRFGAWTAEQRRQFQTLTRPDHLGRFRVLVQCKP
jgi:SAM-dependent MidA family methyltransferase